MSSRSSRLATLTVALLLAATARAADGAGPAAGAVPQMAVFALLLGAVMAAARAGGLLCERLRLPSVFGEFGAGVLLGPALLGRVPLPGLPGGLVAAVAPRLAPGGDLMAVVLLALLALLFLIGLETDVRLIRRQPPAGRLIGLGGSVAALLLTGLVVGRLGRLLPGGVAGALSPTGVFLCVIAAFSSIGIAARSLSGLRRLESPEGIGVMTAAVVDNLAGVLWLAVAAAYVAALRGGAVAGGALAWQVAGRSLAVAVPTAALCFFAVRLISRGETELRRPAGAATLALAAALLMGGLFGGGGLSVLAGAYLVGLALSTTEWRHEIQERLEFMHAAFVPTCFALLGMQLRFEPLRHPGLWLFAAAYVAAAVAGKLAGCALPARLAGFSALGCLRVGLGLVPRGEAALAAAAAGRFAGVLTDGAFAAVVLLLYATGLGAPLLLRLAFRGDRCGVRHAFHPCAGSQLAFRFPSRGSAKMVMARLIDVMAEEGFGAHLLNRREPIYQLSKEGSVIGLRQEGSAMLVNCAEADQALVNSAMVEVLVGIEGTLRELRRPLDAVGLRSTVPEAPAPPATSGSELRAVLSPGTLRPRLLADTKAAVVGELIDLLYEEGLVHDRHDALTAVMAREEGMSTGLEHGLALPHGRTDAVDRLVCAIGIKQEGLDFGSLDGRPARIVVLVLAPASRPAPQIRVISLLSQMLNAPGRAALLACDTAEDMFAVLTTGAPGEGSASRRSRTGSGALVCLQWHSIGLGLSAHTREEVLDQLLALCARSGVVASPEDARQAVLARERKAPTGMEHGLALPHARTEAVERMVCAVGVTRAGVDFGALDGLPSQIFVMVLMPPSVTTEYTRLMGCVMRALDEEGRRAVLAAKTGQQVLDILRRGEKGP